MTTKYCYDGGQVIAEYDGSDNLLRKFIYGPGIDEPICMIDVDGGNIVYYYHFDGVGSVVALSDVNNVIVESYSYDVFGAPTIYDANSSEISQSAIGNPYMFTSRRADDETALYYYRARYYAFDIGRFLQTDPIGYVGGLNLYTYCGNNPLNWIDPHGKERRYFKQEETQKFIEQSVEISAEGGILRGPWKAFGIGGDCDYAMRWPDAMFIVGEDVLTASEFGNYLAGYACSYNYGDTGKLWVKIAGDVFALLDFSAKFGTDEWNGYVLDDPGSRYWINRGIEDARLAVLRNIFGDMYGREEEYRNAQIAQWYKQLQYDLCIEYMYMQINFIKEMLETFKKGS